MPDHLVPDLWTVVPELPLTLGGKVDRERLRTLGAAAGTSQSAGTPVAAGDRESAELAAIWCRVLKIDHVEPDADFFDLGGHSLLANKIVYQVGKRLGLALPLHEVFDRPRFDDLAGVLRALAREAG